jgi:hypothetical protein
MNTRIVVLTFLLVLLVSGKMTLAQSGEREPPIWPAVEQVTSIGGGYFHTNLGWTVSGAASGGDYRLSGPTRATLRGDGCCCTWLPCVLRDFQ